MYNFKCLIQLKILTKPKRFPLPIFDLDIWTFDAQVKIYPMMETRTTGSGSGPWDRKIPTVRVGKKHALYMASIDGHYLVIQFAGASFLKNNQLDILNFFKFYPTPLYRIGVYNTGNCLT